MGQNVKRATAEPAKSKLMGLFFDDIVDGDVFSFGAAELSADDVSEFRRRFAPPLPRQVAPLSANETPQTKTSQTKPSGNTASGSGDDGAEGEAAAQAHVYALWSRMLYEFTFDWPIVARIAQDQLRWYKTARVGDTLSVRITFLTKDPIDSTKGVVITQHDVLNQHGELVMALLTRTAIERRQPAGSRKWTSSS